jgi:hypothetical protein
MSTSSIIGNKNMYFKKIHTKLTQKGKMNVNHIVLYRNNHNTKVINAKNKENSFQKKLYKKDKLSPYKPNFNKLLSLSLLNKVNGASEKPKKLFLKSPLSLLKGVNPPSIQNIDTNKNIPFLPMNLNKINIHPPLNNLHNVEYNSINCIINNFNLSCKNIDSHEENSNKKPENKIKYKNYLDFFNKENKIIRNNMNNLKKNNSMSNYANNIKNLSHLSDINNSNINNITNEDVKAEEILMENKHKQEKIKKKHQENKEKMKYLKELEKKNKRLQNEYVEIKIKHMEYSKSLERLLRFLKVLKNSGMDVNEMMDNISSGEDYDEYVDDDIEESEDTENDKNETVLSDGSVLSNLKQLSSGLLRNHEEYSKGSKLILKCKNIPLLKLNNLKKNS